MPIPRHLKIIKISHDLTHPLYSLSHICFRLLNLNYYLMSGFFYFRHLGTLTKRLYVYNSLAEIFAYSFITYKNWWFMINQALLRKDFSQSKLLMIDHNIKNRIDSKFKLLYFARFFLKHLHVKWAQDNTHYLNTIDFRLTLLFQPYTKYNATLLTTFYAQQMSLIPARRTQRWFLRDIKRFNQWFWVLSHRYSINTWELTTFYALEFNTKGRIIDARRVFSRQHICHIGSLPKSKHITSFKMIPMYSQTTLTTKWGSTNLRVIYYSNPHYHHYAKNFFLSQRRYSRKFWQNHFVYKFAITNELKALNLLTINPYYNLLLQQIGKAMWWRHFHTRKWLLKPITPMRGRTRIAKASDFIFNRATRQSKKVAIIFKQLRFKIIKNTFYTTRDYVKFGIGEQIIPHYPWLPLTLQKRIILPPQSNKHMWYRFLQRHMTLFYKHGKNKLQFQQPRALHKKRRWEFSRFKNYKYYAEKLVLVEAANSYYQYYFFNYKPV